MFITTDYIAFVIDKTRKTRPINQYILFGRSVHSTTAVDESFDKFATSSDSDKNSWFDNVSF